MYTGPKGRHCEAMLSLLKSFFLCWKRAAAQGFTTSGGRSAATLLSYLSEALLHNPERSGLPSAVRGAGAFRSGLPSAVRGIPGVGRCSHCAESGSVAMSKIARRDYCAAGILGPRRGAVAARSHHDDFRPMGCAAHWAVHVPAKAKHVGLYQKFGYWPRYLTAIMTRTPQAQPAPC